MSDKIVLICDDVNNRTKRSAEIEKLLTARGLEVIVVGAGTHFESSERFCIFVDECLGFIEDAPVFNSRKKLITGLPEVCFPVEAKDTYNSAFLPKVNGAPVDRYNWFRQFEKKGRHK